VRSRRTSRLHAADVACAMPSSYQQPSTPSKYQHQLPHASPAAVHMWHSHMGRAQLSGFETLKRTGAEILPLLHDMWHMGHAQVHVVVDFDDVVRIIQRRHRAEERQRLLRQVEICFLCNLNLNFN